MKRSIAESRAEVAAIPVVAMVVAEAQPELKSAAADTPDDGVVTAVVNSAAVKAAEVMSVAVKT